MERVSWFLPRCQNQIQGLFKDFEGPYEGYSRKTTLTQNSTFIGLSKQVQFIFDNLTLASINKKQESSEIVTKCIRCISCCHGVKLLRIAFIMSIAYFSHVSHYLHYLQGHVCDVTVAELQQLVSSCWTVY